MSNGTDHVLLKNIAKIQSDFSSFHVKAEFMEKSKTPSITFGLMIKITGFVVARKHYFKPLRLWKLKTQSKIKMRDLRQKNNCFSNLDQIIL